MKGNPAACVPDPGWQGTAFRGDARPQDFLMGGPITGVTVRSVIGPGVYAPRACVARTV